MIDDPAPAFEKFYLILPLAPFAGPLLTGDNNPCKIGDHPGDITRKKDFYQNLRRSIQIYDILICYAFDPVDVRKFQSCTPQGAGIQPLSASGGFKFVSWNR